MTDLTDSKTDNHEDWHRKLAPIAFNHTWTLLDLDERTAAEEEDMLSATFSQRFHWYQVGNARNQAIADWQVSRVAAVLGYAELARRFGEVSLQTCHQHDLDSFVRGFAHEAIARAAAEVDDVETFTTHLEAARSYLHQIEDDEERQVLEADLDQMTEE